MKLITLQSEVWQSLLSQLQTIHESLNSSNRPDYSDLWLNETEVCEYLQLSPRTMSRMRKGGEITFAKLHGKYFYTIGEIIRVLDNRRIGSTANYLEELTQKGKKYVEKGIRLKSSSRQSIKL